MVRILNPGTLEMLEGKACPMDNWNHDEYESGRSRYLNQTRVNCRD